MDRILHRIFSMALMAVGLFLFFVAIGAATFVENDFGRLFAQKWIYQTLWFESLIFYLFLSLIYNIYRFKMWQLKKLGTLVFHVSLLVIIIGAWITRNFGFEGVMHIREGASSNYILSRETYIQIKVHDLKNQYTVDLPILLDTNAHRKKADGTTDFSSNYFVHEFDFPGQNESVKIEFADFIPNVKDTLIPEVGGKTYLDIVTSGMKHNYLESGKILSDGGVKIAFNNNKDSSAVQIFETDSGLCVLTPVDLNFFEMSSMTTGIIPADSVKVMHTKRAYDINGFNFVLSQYYPSAFLDYVQDPGPATGIDGMVVQAKQGEQVTEVVLRGGEGTPPTIQSFQMGNLFYELAWGSKVIELPFSIYLDDFVLEKYPGGQSPSAYSSYVTLIDHATGKQTQHHIFMNNVLDYGGYRFFQSSYDPDEQGTILSVNFDKPGTFVSYLGYFLMGLGFLLNLFSKNSRFRQLLKKSAELNAKIASLIILLFLGFSQNDAKAEITRVVSEEHAEKFGKLIIQDFDGRFKPVHTMATDLLRKIYRDDNYKGLNPVQVYLGIITNFEEWNLEPIILIPGSGKTNELTKKLNLPDGTKYACIQDFITMEGTYILTDDVESAHQKSEGARNQFDKDLLKLDERFNIALGLYYGFYFKLFPLPGDPENTWVSPFDEEAPFNKEDGEFVQSITKAYFQGVFKGYQSGDWTEADLAVSGIEFFQRRIADSKVIPSESQIEWEITYNKMNIFDRLSSYYLYLGFLILIFGFVQIFVRAKWVAMVLNILYFITVFAFLSHAFGLGLRAYISGHAPWSNGYEAFVYICGVLVLIGLIFGFRNKVILGSVLILSWLMLFVAHLETMDPQITPLVPVLKSYWLKIHVAVITGSYAFLGLSAMLALTNMVMFIFTNEANKSKLLNAGKDLTYIIEVSMILGLFTLSIGTFLGGVWANESWGRYWGWDPKETWALASMLVYAIILHFRFIPKMKGMFTFNVAALWGYASIIMTFFGVNYYLVGLHSYAKGDPVPIPTWVPVTVIILLILTKISQMRYLKFYKS